MDTVGKVSFDNALAIPPLAPSRVAADGRRVFELTAQPGRSEFRPGQHADTWGFNGAYLGPTLRMRRGEKVAVKARNALPEATTVHWHGMHLPAIADGGPHQMIDPGDSRTPSWRVDQPAATLWYHPHPHGATEGQVRRGLAGMVIVDDDAEASLPLPRDYGVDDVPVIVQDVRLDDDGQRAEGRQAEVGQLGDTLLVNGTIGPYHEVRAELTRLRLLNASTARIYDFGLSDGRELTLIATDGGLLGKPYRTDRIRLSPGERAEVVVAMAPGEDLTLRSFPADLGASSSNTRDAGGDDSFDVLRLRANDTLASSPPLPDRLAPLQRLNPADAAQTRSFELRSRRINDKKMNMRRIDTVVTKDTIEVWKVVNGHGRPHNFHIHDVQFQVLSVDGAPPPPELAGWKDTVYLPPRVPIRLIMRFADYADPATPYMYHCHLLRHEDRGMMGQFVVVEPGQRPVSGR